MEMGEGVDVRLLHYVFDFGFVTDNGARRTVDALVVASHQDLEERPVAGLNPPDDLRIGQGRVRGLGNARLNRVHTH